jgi:signal transduction histidine kinase
MNPEITKQQMEKTSKPVPVDPGERYNNLVDILPMGVFSLGQAPEYPVISVNHMMVQMLGCDGEDQVIGRSARDLVLNPQNWGQFENDLADCGEVRSREVLLKHRKGQDICVSIHARAQRTPDNAICRVEGCAEDVTERRVFETEMQYHASELNRYALALTHANNKLNLLSNITRHDILNQLTAFGMYLELMKTSVSDKKILECIEMEEKVSETIREQILFTRDYQEIGVVTPQWYNVKKTILAATAPLPLSSDTLTINIDNLSVYADPLLGKVFYNLVENGLRHGEGLTRITFSCTPPDTNGITLVCEDNGTGVPPQYKEAIFNRQHFRHTGFGLFLSREILAISGLSIRETGEPGKGARFEITVPPGNFRMDEQEPS